MSKARYTYSYRISYLATDDDPKGPLKTIEGEVSFDALAASSVAKTNNMAIRRVRRTPDWRVRENRHGKQIMFLECEVKRLGVEQLA